MADTISERSEPVASMIPAWAVLVLALGSGVCVFVGVGLLAIAFGWPVRVPLGASGCAVLVVWFGAVVRAEVVLWVSERSGPVVAEAVRSRPVVAVEISEPERGRMAYIDLPGSPEALCELARGILAGRPFSESEWCGSGSHRPYSRADFRQLRAVMLDRGLCTWRNPESPTQGVVLSAVGRVVFREIANRGTRTPAYVRQDGARMLHQGDG
jgi:hypothetical protein